ncbi:ribonuclease D [Shewanella colwelliana]|uniref:Ribonuclease D n=1 Tax=Shewanella colwelliana TaxID=23 RepID=A0A1E5IQ64_SHECO|nr:ribonuclease D [Shewanella colwelliana]MDX1280255.1 ribonuclease D [Shewanella colwelliana]OEG72188.1 ribonuclease D [Shewanella colwelliana]GIU34982.1 ribonuclease D [Shewanella colwelliana]
MLTFQYIEDDASLAKLVEQYRQASVLVLDTEFVRTRTYYAQLGLIQVYDGQSLALIDPVAISDLSGFWALLERDDMVTVLHSCSEDLEVLARYGQCQPKVLFDSQIAAALCGLGHGLGYAKLVEHCLEVSLDKGESRTDWLKRPLSDAQLHYAANDVEYLYQLYPQLVDKLNATDRLAWVYEEGERMTQGRLDAPDGETAYLKVKNSFQLSPKQLAYLKVLAKWRLDKALEKDLALGFVIKDHALIALAKKQPKTSGDIFRMTELTEQEKRVHAKAIVAILATADLDNLPKAIDVIALKPGYKSAFKTIKTALQAVAEAQDVPMELIGSKRHIHEFLQWIWDDKAGEKPLLLSGWRSELVETILMSLEL